MDTQTDKLWIAYFADGGAVQSLDEDKVRKAHAENPGSTLVYRPWPSQVKLPWIENGDYEFSYDQANGVDLCIHLKTGVTGWGLDRNDAYRSMLRVMREQQERKLDVIVAAGA